MSLYTPTVWVENETPRSAALFNKREQGVNALFKKRAYFNSNSISYDYLSAGYVEFGNYNSGSFYDYDGTGRYDSGVITVGSNGDDQIIHMPEWASFGMVAVTINFENIDHNDTTIFELKCGNKYSQFKFDDLAIKNHNTMHARVVGNGDVSLYCNYNYIDFGVKLSALFY